MKWLRRILNRNRPFICKSCGYRVPVIGSRRQQAIRAWNHWVALHESETN